MTKYDNIYSVDVNANHLQNHFNTYPTLAIYFYYNDQPPGY